MSVSFFNKVAGLRPATLLNKRLWHGCFPVNFAKLLRTSFLQNTSGRLLLYVRSIHLCPGGRHQNHGNWKCSRFVFVNFEGIQYYIFSTLISLISVLAQYSISVPLEHIRKTVFLRFQGISKWRIGLKWVHFNFKVFKCCELTLELSI